MRKVLTSVTIAVLLFPCPMRAQDTPLLRKVFSSDTLNVNMPALSPDGRWLVFTQYVSNQQVRLMISPLAGGEAHELLAESGTHMLARFTPRGDRLIFISSLPRRSATDDHSYLVGAPFDTRTGTLSGPPRQITLDGVRIDPRLRPAISPDGQWIAYAQCCETNALKVIPITGGNARTLVEAPSAPQPMPGWLAWTPDSRFVLYHLREEGESVRYKVSREGGAPTALTRFKTQMGIVSPDTRYFAAVEGRVRSTLRLFSADGHEIAHAAVPHVSWVSMSFSPDGKYILGMSDNATAAIKLAPVAGGPIRQIGLGRSYEWAEGWDEDGQTVHISSVENERRMLRLTGLHGEVKDSVQLPDDGTFIGIQDGYAVYREGTPGSVSDWRLVAVNLENRTRRELARDVVSGMCCDPVGAGGMYYGITGKEFYFRQLKGDRLQIRSMNVNGESRLLADLPRSYLGKTGFSVFENRVVYTETLKDSVRLRMVTGPGRAPTTIGTFAKTLGPGENAWSYDGRHLAVFLGGAEQTLLVYHFDAAGATKGHRNRSPFPSSIRTRTSGFPTAVA